MFTQVGELSHVMDESSHGQVMVCKRGSEKRQSKGKHFLEIVMSISS